MKAFLKGLKYLFYTGVLGLSAYCLYYLAVYSYLIYAIEHHYEHMNDGHMEPYLQYMESSYAERYMPPNDWPESIPDSAFWIPENQHGGRFIAVSIADNIKNTFNVKMYLERNVVDSCVEYKNTLLILKEGAENVSLSQFITPNLPLDKVTLRAGIDSSVPKEIKKRLPKKVAYRYLEYGQGYLVFKEFLESKSQKCWVL